MLLHIHGINPSGAHLFDVVMLNMWGLEQQVLKCFLIRDLVQDWKRWCCVPFINFFIMAVYLGCPASWSQCVAACACRRPHQVICMGLMQGVQLCMAHEAQLTNR